VNKSLEKEMGFEGRGGGGRLDREKGGGNE